MFALKFSPLYLGIVLSLLTPQLGVAVEVLSSSEFYKVREVPTDLHSLDDSQSQRTTANEFYPTVLWEEVQSALQKGARLYSLLSFDSLKGQYGEVLEPYNRSKHFRGWVFPEGGCQNTRARVLIENSQKEVRLSKTGCVVISGEWSDAYTNKEYTSAFDMQIDHFVPLKNAYISGADKWSFKQRCLYANYQGNKFHLLPVFGEENSKKSDRTPAQYMPPNKAYACTYLANWLKIKLIWSLNISTVERKAVENLAKAHDCQLSDLSYTDTELIEQRQHIADNQNLCQ